MRYSDDQKIRTRRRLVKETAETIRREGVHAVGVASVMAKLGLTHGGFYAHFPSRDALIVAGVRQMLEDGRKLAAPAAVADPAEALDRFIEIYLSAAHRDMANGACPLPILGAEAPRLPGSSRDDYAAGAEALRRILAEHLSALGRPDPEALAASALAELVGAVALARAEPDPGRSDAILSASRAALRARLGLEGQS